MLYSNFSKPIFSSVQRRRIETQSFYFSDYSVLHLYKQIFYECFKLIDLFDSFCDMDNNGLARSGLLKYMFMKT